MCKDEYVMLMTWKKTAAGDVIYNKCPPNATGEGHGEGGPQPVPPLGKLQETRRRWVMGTWLLCWPRAPPCPLCPIQGPPAAGAC